MRTLIKYSLIFFIILVSLTVFSNKTISNPTDQIRQYENEFNFDWTNAATIATSKEKIYQIEAYLLQIPDLNNLSASDRKALGKLLYKMGSYYAHVNHDFDLAIVKFTTAKKLLPGQKDQLIIDNQLAYAHALEYAAYKQNEAPAKAFALSDKIIKSPATDKFNLAFAYYVQGLTAYETKNYHLAQDNLHKSLQLYQQLSAQNQAAMVNNQIAKTFLAENQNEEAVKLLERLQSFWLTQINYEHNPDAANHFVTLGDAYLKIKKPAAARDQFLRAIQIYQTVYGEHSNMLINSYEGLGLAYTELGEQEKAQEYQQKAATLACPL